MPEPCPRPADFVVLSILGRDAQDFLQRQLATDLRRLNVAAATPACLLAANGRVLASGTLLKRAEADFSWVLHATLADATAVHLRRFVLRSKLTLAIDPQQHLSPASRLPDAAPRWRDSAGRALGLGDQPVVWTATESTQFAAAAIRAGWVDLDARLADRFLPQMLDLHRAGAIALDKGCYPGQEIVARTHYLGRIKRVLRCLRCAAEPLLAPGLQDADGRLLGDWLHACTEVDGWLGLAVLEASADEVWAVTAAGPALTQSQTISSGP